MVSCKIYKNIQKSNFSLKSPLLKRQQVVSWDDKNIFIEHRFVARKSTIKEFVYFVSLVKLRVLKTPVAELMKEYFAAENLEVPDVSVSALVDIMREYDECSSEQLKEELAVK